LKAKLRILRILDSALRRKDAAGLWQKCLLALTENLTANQVEFLFKSELCYTYFDIRTGQTADFFSAMNAGGLADILSIIGHCEKEITLRTFSRTRDRLADVVRDDRLNAPRLKVKSYFEALRLGYDKCLDDAYNEFQSTNVDEKLFWDHFIDRLNSAVKSEFKSDVIIHKQVKSKHVAKFEPKMTQFAQHLDSSLELNGEFPNIITSVAVSGNAQREEYGQVFRQDGNMWTVRFNGIHKLVKDLDGMRYIRYLLESPGKEFWADELYDLVKPKESKQYGNEDAILSRDEIVKEYQICNKRAAKITDPEEQNGYRLALDERQIYKEKLLEASEAGDEKAVAQIRKTIKDFNRVMNSYYDHKGQPRAASDPLKLERQAVSSSIIRAVKNIRSVHPQLADHLKTIKQGKHISYDGGLNWQTDEIAHTIRQEKPQIEWCA
jgi:hypothetical protein